MELRAGTGVSRQRTAQISRRDRRAHSWVSFSLFASETSRGTKIRPDSGPWSAATPSPGVDATGWDGDPPTGWQEAYGIGLSGVEIHARYGVLCHRITWAATATGSPHPWVFFSLFVSRTGRDTRIRPISRSSS